MNPNTVCEMCEKDFLVPTKLRRHKTRKTPCALIIEKADLAAEVLEDPDLDQKRCHFCGRVFVNYTSMRRHIRNTCKIAPNKKNGDTGMEILYEYTLRRQQAQIDTLQIQNEQMLGMMQQIVNRDGNSAQLANIGAVALQGNQNQVAVDNSKDKKVLNINIFGQESMEHVTPEKIKAILDEALRTPNVAKAAQIAVLKTAQLVYSNPDYPENHTCYLPNKKSNDVMVHTKNGWEIQAASTVLPPMATTCIDCIFDMQPYDHTTTYTQILKELADNEDKYSTGSDIRTILVRNRSFITHSLKVLPVVGTP